MTARKILAAAGATILAGSILLPAVASSAAPLNPAGSVAGTVHGTASRVVDPTTAKPVAANLAGHAPLLRDGTYARAQVVARASRGTKTGAGGDGVSPDTGVISAQFNGVAHTTAGCNCESSPSANAAIGPTDVVEIVGAQLSVFTRAGAPGMSVSLNTLLGTSSTLAFPRVIYDPVWHRWVLAVEALPASVTDYPILWTAVSATSDPSGLWYTNSVQAYWAGLNGVADFPIMGMDRQAILLSTNNYEFDTGTSTYSYLDSTYYAIPKDAIYNNSGAWNSLVFFVPFGTAPAIVSGNPTSDLQRTYLLAIDYTNHVIKTMYILNSAHYGRQKALSLPDTIYNLGAPSRNANQPGTAVTLATGDGRISTAPAQVGFRIWFANGADVGSFPDVNYGFIAASHTPVLHANTAFHSSTSDDFNPAITAVLDGSGKTHAFLTWAYTDTTNNVSVHDVWAAQTGLTPTHRAGAIYSPDAGNGTVDPMSTVASAAADYYPPCGSGALVTNQYFSTAGKWKTRLAEVGVC
jgi:hypothetical protein